MGAKWVTEAPPAGLEKPLKATQPLKDAEDGEAARAGLAGIHH